MFEKQDSIRLAVSRKMFGFVPDWMAFRTLARINTLLGVNLGMEYKPHRLANTAGLERLSDKYGAPIVGIHAELQADPRVFLWEIKRNIIKQPPDIAEAINCIKWLVLFGATQEPSWTKRYGTSLRLAESLGAYLVMHCEPLGAMSDDQIAFWAQKIKIVRENGWGPKEERVNPLHWDPVTIRDYADKHKINTCLDTSTAARNGLNIIEAFRIMRPQVIHFSDYRINPQTGLNEENLPPGQGDHKAELGALVKTIYNSSHDITLVMEFSHLPDILGAISQTLEFINDHRGR